MTFKGTEERQYDADVRDDRSRVRDEQRSVKCPSCGAKPGESCHGVRGLPRAANHIERVRRWREQNGTN